MRWKRTRGDDLLTRPSVVESRSTTVGAAAGATRGTTAGDILNTDLGTVLGTVLGLALGMILGSGKSAALGIACQIAR